MSGSLRGRRVLVTGATGYVGGRLAERLLAEGVETHLLVLPTSDRARLAPLGGATVHVHDETAEGAERIIRAARPEAILHIAARVWAEHAPADVEPLIRANVLLGTHLLDALARAGGGVFIQTGTFWQRRGGAGYDPVNLYAATKEAFEAILGYFAATAPIRAAVLVLYDVYGPADPRGKILSLLDRATRTGEALEMTPGEQRIDLVHVNDAVEAYLAAWRALEAAPAGPPRTWAVSGGEARPLREVVETFERAVGRPVPVRWGAKPYRPREVMTPWRGEPVPGWRPRVGLEDGIRAAYGAREAAGTAP